MTLPEERLHAVIAAGNFLRRLMLTHPAGGYKRIPRAVREEARQLLKHYPTSGDLLLDDCFYPGGFSEEVKDQIKSRLNNERS